MLNRHGQTPNADHDDELLSMHGRLQHAINTIGTPTMLHIGINVSGMACGPVSTQAYIGFEIAPI